MTAISGIIRGILLLAASGACIAGACHLVRTAVAHQAAGASPAQWARAAELEPDRADFQRMLGLALKSSDREAAHKALSQAVQRNPYDADSQMALGLMAFEAGEMAEAQSRFRRAASVSRRYNPHLMLASFYRSAGMRDEFWQAARQAAAIPAADLSRLFELAAQMEPDPARVVAGLDLHTPHATSSYLAWLLGRKGVEGVEETAIRLAKTGHRPDLLLASCNRLLDSAKTDEAIAVWNAAAAAGAIEGEQLRPDLGQSLTNAAFRETQAAGFDWRVPSLHGIEVTWWSTDGVRIEFSGQQREFARVLQQIAPVRESARYRFSLNYSYEGTGQPAGLEWKASGLAPGSEAASMPLQAGENRTATMDFEASGNLVVLSLDYRRAIGSRRIEGVLSLHSAKLERLP